MEIGDLRIELRSSLAHPILVAPLVVDRPDAAMPSPAGVSAVSAKGSALLTAPKPLREVTRNL